MPDEAAVTPESMIARAAVLVGESEAMVEVRQLIGQVAPSDASVIITGPSGSGKELVARAVHAASARFAQPYVAVNCGAIPRDLLESELFGHEKGAFTGAVNQRCGRFEEAHGGTLFLDEIGDMPADMQVKLLRVLEERTIQRVGGRGEIAVDNRIVSATHRDIDEAIDEQRFREDLFYRLAVFPIHLPSLAERREDIPLLVRSFLRRKADVRFSQPAMDRLMVHNWPGNVRELRNLVERASILHPSRAVGAEEVDALLLPRRSRPVAAAPVMAIANDIAPALTGNSEPALPLIGEAPVDLRSLVAKLEERYILEALLQAGGVVAEAARTLKLQRTTLIEKMRKLGLSKAA
ncbi:MAG TPA: sigma-54 dependent transcriptional regulator [Sphingomicrobium sp.]|nr:sigma-54 dependent transcriptional regulator [Sphingomicrobium sp.]